MIRLGGLTPKRGLPLAVSVLHIPSGTNVYRFGDSNSARPVFRNIKWTINDGESWAVVGSNEKTTLLETLDGRLRISPSPPHGLFPLAESITNGINLSRLVSFTPRTPTDPTTRYGALRDDDSISLRNSILSSAQGSKNDSDILDALGLTPLLDLPLITLSSGQTRRARIARALFSNPYVLLLDEPLSGLDAENRASVLSLLHTLHTAHRQRIIVGLRTHDSIPAWITHLALARGDEVLTGPKQKVVPHIQTHVQPNTNPIFHLPARSPGKLVVDMKDVNVRYGRRKVLKNITWQIRAGERWHLQGSNGSGKSTILALLTGAHPLSFAQPHLHLFNRPRTSIPTPHLATLVSTSTPTLPTTSNITVWDVLRTGFGFPATQPLTDAQTQRIWDVLHALPPLSLSPSTTLPFHTLPLRTLPAHTQALVFLMRVLVARAPLVLLDEAFAGLDARAVAFARGEVGNDQAVVVVSHRAEEVPWADARVFRLEDGTGTVIQ